MSKTPNSDSPQGRLSKTPERAFDLNLDDLLDGPPLPEEMLPAGVTREDDSLEGLACPAAGDWIRLACGDVDPLEADQLLAHAAGCEECSDRLRMCMRLLSEKATEDESAAVAAQASSSPEWSQRMAAKLARTPRKSRFAKFPKAYLWTGLGLAASLLLSAGVALQWQRDHAAEKLLAEAYTSSRVFDLRMAGAGFATVSPGTHLRGSNSGHENAALLEARTRIARELESSPDSPHWLQLQARADVLEEKFDSAIDILDRLQAAGPVSASLLVDGASAYFERGTCSGSESDRATALDYLRRADEMAPDDPVVLFNEAVVMEDRGQVMNAVETWNRFLRFERDPHWLSEGRSRLDSLEIKLNQLKSHQSRVDRHLASPKEMRALAADAFTLAALDEELVTTQLPRLIDAAFPLPVDRSRGSPCLERCAAARVLLQALATSLTQFHRDPWLSHFLPIENPQYNSEFALAAHALGSAMEADASGDYESALAWAAKGRQLFHQAGNPAGEDRAEVERGYALQRSSRMAGCFQVASGLLRRAHPYAWIEAQALTEEEVCNEGPQVGPGQNSPAAQAVSLAKEHHFMILNLRARNILVGEAVESGDVERAWQINIGTLRMFYAGDYPPFRAYTTLAGLAEVEKSTPRAQLSLLLQHETMGLLELTESRKLIPAQRYDLAVAAIRAGAISEAVSELRKVQSELPEKGIDKPTQSFLANSEISLAKLYLGKGDYSSASSMLGNAQAHMAGGEDGLDRRDYAAAQGELDLAQGKAGSAESALRNAILDDERRGGTKNVLLARQDRELYAVLAGVWLSEGRSGEDILALWERYRLRILGQTVSPCAAGGLDCLKPQLLSALGHLGPDHAYGQLVLLDRVLRYKAGADGVRWTSVPAANRDILTLAQELERATSSPKTSQDSVDQAARRVGNLLLEDSPSGSGPLILESDPLLGNLPWPAVESGAGPLGLHFDLQETPSLLLASRSASSWPKGGHPLLVGASLASEEGGLLPEVLAEVRDVARFGHNPTVLVSSDATEAEVIAHLGSADALHFAGHAIQQDGSTRLLLAPSGTSSRAAMPYLDSALLRKYPPRAARLAVLSACSTGRKNEGWNHGIGDIVETLASLNVPEVVATRWEIDSAASVPLMDAFYSGLARGLPVPQALTAARLSLSRDARYRHPYFWAASYVSGWGRSDLRDVYHAY